MEKPKRRPNLFLRFLAFLLTLALVLGAVFLVANWQKLNFDSVKRYFTYRSLSKNDGGQAESFSYDGAVTDAFACVDSDLLLCSASGVRLYSGSGTNYVTENLRMDHPVLSAGKKAGLVYDAGAQHLFVYSDRQQVFSLALEAGSTVLSASLNAQDALTVVTQKSGYKGVVTVYNTSYEPVISVNLSSRFITDAILSPDGKTVAIATAGQTDGVYDSQIAFYPANAKAKNEGPAAIASLGNDAILKLSWAGGDLKVLGENALTLLKADGSTAGAYSYDGGYLKGCALDGDGFSALLLGKYRAGAAGQHLVLVDGAGAETADLSLDEQILSLDAAGRYLSVLTADHLSIYDPDLTVYHDSTDTQGARKVLQRADGSVLLISTGKARLYLPQ